MIKHWFLTEGKLAAVLIKPPSWGSQLDGNLHYHTPPQHPPPSSTQDREGPEALPGTLPERGIAIGGLLHRMLASGAMSE
jgi:hypothetical protein